MPMLETSASPSPLGEAHANLAPHMGSIFLKINIKTFKHNRQKLNLTRESDDPPFLGSADGGLP